MIKSTEPNDLESNCVMASSVSSKSGQYVSVVIVTLYVVHIAILAYFANSYFEQIRIGAINIGGPLLGLISDIVMLAGVILLILKRYGSNTFLLASAGSLFAGLLVMNQRLPFHIGSFVLLTYGFGFALSIFAWWFTIRLNRRGGV